MLKIWIVLVLLSGCLAGGAQQRTPTLADVDWYVQKVPVAKPALLAQTLTAPYSSELLKVRAIFRWITNNIAYPSSRLYVARQSINRRHKLFSADEMVLDTFSLNERVANEVLEKGEAICNGYTRLFKTLCDFAGIHSQIITGYVKGSGRTEERFRSNHAWNAVRIDSTWHLLDVTWASGYMTYADEFVPRFDEYYFLTPPQQFIRSHYPEDLQWTLLQNPPTLKEFERSPFKHGAFIKYGIIDFTPATGVLEATAGDTLSFKLSVKDAARNHKIASEGSYDSLMQVAMPNWAFALPAEDSATGTIWFTHVAREGQEWLHLVYNGDVILRYRVYIRPRNQLQ